MNTMDYLNEITFSQIFKYFEFEIVDKTAFYIVFHKNDNEYILFLNKELDNKISVLDIKTRNVIDKEDLLISLSFNLETEGIVNKIKNEVINVDTTLVDVISTDDLINYLYGFCPLSKSNKNLQQYSTTEFLFSPDFSNLFQDKDDKIIVPLFKDGVFVNYYISDKASASLKFTDSVGYYNSKNRSENTNLIFSFNIFNVFDFFQENLSIKYQVFIPNKNLTILSVTSIFKLLDTNQFKPDKITFLYQEGDIQEGLSTLKFFVNVCSLFHPSRYILDIDPSKRINLQIIPPKQYKMLNILQFFGNLNKDVYKILQYDPKDESNKSFLNKYLFEIEAVEIENSKTQIISFLPKAELIYIFLINLNSFVFGEASIYEFTEIKEKYFNSNVF